MMMMKLNWVEKPSIRYIPLLPTIIYLLFRGSLLHFVPFVFLLDSYLFLPFPSSYCYSYFDLKIFSCIYIISTLTFCKKLLNKISWRDNGKSAKKICLYIIWGPFQRLFFSHKKMLLFISLYLFVVFFFPPYCYCCCCLTFLLTIFHSKTENRRNLLGTKKNISWKHVAKHHNSCCSRAELKRVEKKLLLFCIFCFSAENQLIMLCWVCIIFFSVLVVYVFLSFC